MVSKRDLLPAQPPPSKPYRPPRDPVGTRPRGETPRGPLRLLWTALVALRFHLWRILQFVVLAVAVSGVVLLLVALAAHRLGQAEEGEASCLTYIASWLLVSPLLVGCSHALLLLLQEYAPPWYEVVRPFLSLRLYGHVLVAALPTTALGWAASSGLARAGTAEWIAEMVGEGPWSTWLAALPQALVSTLVMLPFTFAALNAVALRSPFWRSLARNVRFAVREPGLLLAFGLFVFIASSAISLVFSWMRAAETSVPKELPWIVLVVFGGYGAAFVCMTLIALLHPVFYREFVWREREARAAAVTSGP